MAGSSSAWSPATPHGRLYKWWCDIQQVKGNSAEKRGHPCQAPLDVMRRVLRLCAYEGDLVIDPCSGSQSTAIAAHELGLDYIGIELTPSYIESGAGLIKTTLGIDAPIIDINQLPTLFASPGVLVEA